MAKIDVMGTEFTFSILPLKIFSRGFWARTELGVKNAYLSYRDTSETITREELENWIFSMFRLLAGAYGEECSIMFERAGFSVDFYPYTENGEKVSREKRRQNDCVMAIRLLMRGAGKKEFLGGVYTLLLHRKDVELFALQMKEEYEKIFAQRIHGRGKYLFVGVSPLGYKGCNYWYFDSTGQTAAGDYVWVEMGRHNTKQIVLVDSVRYFSEDTAPYSIGSVRRVLRKATEGEVENVHKR